MKWFDKLWNVLFILLLISIPFSVYAQGDDPLPDSDLVAGLFDADVLSVFMGVFVALLLTGFMFILFQALKYANLSVPQDVFSDFSKHLTEAIDKAMDKARETAPLTITPFDDIGVAIADYTLPMVLSWLEDMQFADDDIVSIMAATRTPPTPPFDDSHLG